MTYTLIILVVGILVGGGLRIAVNEILLWLRRREVGKALLVEIKACCTKAKNHAHYSDEHILQGDWLRNVLQKQYLHTIDKPLYDACLKNPSQPPTHHLDKLVLFHDFVGVINHKIYAFREEQERLEHLANKPNADVKQCESITRALGRLVHTTARMCDELKQCQSIEKLGDLPTSYKDEYPVPQEFQ